MSTTHDEVDLITWGGIDVSSETFEVCCLAPGQRIEKAGDIRKFPKTQYDRTRTGVERMLSQLPEGKVCLVMESTGRYSLQLAHWIHELSPAMEVSIVNPRRVLDHARSLGVRSKTDPIDAGVIASYGKDRRPKSWSPASSNVQGLQVLSRTRQSLVESRTAHDNRLKDLMRANLPTAVRGDLLESLQSVIDVLTKQIEALEQSIEDLLQQEIELKADVDLLDTIPGIGKVVAVGLVSELGNMRRFGNRNTGETFAGLNVTIKQSGKKAHCRGLSKEGSERVRRLLYLAAMAAIRGKNNLRAFYQHLVSGGKKKKVALSAVMRKLLNVARRIIITGLEYNDAKIGQQI